MHTLTPCCLAWVWEQGPPLQGTPLMEECWEYTQEQNGWWWSLCEKYVHRKHTTIDIIIHVVMYIHSVPLANCQITCSLWLWVCSQFWQPHVYTCTCTWFANNFLWLLEVLAMMAIRIFLRLKTTACIVCTWQYLSQVSANQIPRQQPFKERCCLGWGLNPRPSVF